MTYATKGGTARYRDRYTDLPGHFRRSQGLWLSSIGIGTYLGRPGPETDAAYTKAITRAIDLGCNVIDTAANYRSQHSERAIGLALKRVFKSGAAARDEIVVATKGGYIAYDPDHVRDPKRYERETFIDTGLVTADEIIDGHCMSPRFLQMQIDQSLHNLGLETIDVYYVHDPESQLESITRNEFRERLRRAFRMLEEAVEQGLIQYYGTATWNCYRNPPGATEYVSLEDVLTLARDVRGLNHHCRFIQLPYNLAMLEAVTSRNQSVSGERMSTVEAAERQGVCVMCSASLLQARLLGQLPEDLRSQFAGLSTDAQRCLQFVRSTPGVTVALTGMSQLRHVEENLATAKVEPLPPEKFKSLFS